MLLRELEPEKYWSFPSSYSREKRELEIGNMIASGLYSFQLKTDGNYSAFVCVTDGNKRIISRGVSKTTGEYGRIEDRLFFFDAVAAAFDKPTRIMGEVYYDNGIDRNVGSVLRASPLKSKSIQDEEFYIEASRTTKFTAKDHRDIEGNEFRNKKLKWRIFDVWYYDGESLMNTPWIERQKYVKAAAERINHPLVTAVNSYAMDDSFYDKLNTIFAAGGEGVVCYKNSGLPEPGKRTAHKTLKVKRELEHLIDCVITGTDPATIDYTGKEIGTWMYWQDTRTGEKLFGQYFGDYQTGHSIKPISRGYYMDWPGAIYVGVYDRNQQLVPLCKVANLTDEFREDLKEHFDEWYMCPVTIGGMAISEATGLSIRHPYLKSIRKDDLDPLADCTLDKILN